MTQNSELPPMLLNHYAGKMFQDTLSSAFRTIFDLLKHHCGPYATNAILPTQAGGTMIIDQYTKDGINIVKSLRTDTPLTRHVMRLVSYIGERVDNACHDGTTTAMMLFCDIASQLCKHWPDDDPSGVAYRRQYLTEALWAVLHDCELLLQAHTLTVDDIASQFHTTKERALWAIAYHQALIAAKGDRELAEGVAEVLSSMPVDLHGQYMLHRPGLETDKRFSIKRHDYDFELPGQVVNFHDYNHALGSELRIDDVLLLVTPNELIRGSSEVEWLYQLLTSEQFTAELTKPLVIMTPSLNDPQLYDIIQKHNATHPSAKIIGLHMQVQNNAKIFADAICAIAGVLPLQMAMTGAAGPMLIDFVGVEQRGTRIYLRNLGPKTGARLHPSYTDPSRNEFYTHTIKEVRQFIEKATSRQDPSAASEQMLTHVINVYRYMASQELIDLSIGGPSHENLANIAVAKDAYGAAVSAIQDGVILGGHQRLLACILSEMKLFRQPDSLASPDLTQLPAPLYARWHVLECFAQALCNTLSIIYYANCPKEYAKQEATLSEECAEATLLECAEDFVGEYNDQLPHNQGWFYLEAGRCSAGEPGSAAVSINDEDFTITAQLLPNVSGFLTGETTGSVLMQPAMGYKEFFKRMRELLPLVINTTALIDTYHVTERR